MSQRLAPAKILAALQRGDAGPLLEFHRTVFGNARMEGEGDKGGGEDKGDGKDEDDEDAGGAGDSGDKDDKVDPRVKALSDENAKRRNNEKALKKQNDELAARLKAIEDKDKSELEKTTSEKAEAAAKAEAAETALVKLRIENAFLTDNKHTWANPKAALKLADLSEVEIDDEGNVTGLREALDALAKSDPYLLAKAKKDEDDEDDEDEKPGRTGQPVGKGKAKGNPDREKLIKKYPALQR